MGFSNYVLYEYEGCAPAVYGLPKVFKVVGVAQSIRYQGAGLVVFIT